MNRTLLAAAVVAIVAAAPCAGQIVTRLPAWSPSIPTGVPAASIPNAEPSRAFAGAWTAPALFAAPAAPSLPAFAPAPAAPAAFAAPAPAFAPALPLVPAASAGDGAAVSGGEGRRIVAETASSVAAGSTDALFTGETRRRGAPVFAEEAEESRVVFGGRSPESRAAASGVPAPERPSRDITMTEFQILNAAGMAVSVAVGFLTHSFWIGFLGIYVAAIPLIYLYVAVRRARGERINFPGFRFRPGVSFAGRRYSLRRED